MTDGPKKVRKSRLPTDPRAAVEKRVGKTKNAIRGLAKKFPGEVLSEDAIGKIVRFLRVQVDTLENELHAALRSGGTVTVGGFSLDAPEAAQTVQPPSAANYRTTQASSSGSVPSVPRALAATAEDAPDLVRVLTPGSRKSPAPDVSEIDFVEE